MTKLVNSSFFNSNNIIFSKAEQNQLPGQKLQYKRIKINYQHNDNEISDLILESPSNLMCWGLSPNHDMVTGQLSGYQAAIQLWNRNGPSNEERGFTDMVEKILEKVKTHLCKEETKEEIERFDLELSDLKKMKPLYWPMERGVRVPDKSPTLYAKVMYSKKENRIATNFVNEITKQNIEPLEILGKHMHVKFALKCESIFIGNTIALQFKLSEVHFKLKDTSLRSLLDPSLNLTERSKLNDVNYNESNGQIGTVDDINESKYINEEDEADSEYEEVEVEEDDVNYNYEEDDQSLIEKNLSKDLLQKLETKTEVIQEQPPKIISTTMETTKKRGTRSKK